MAATKKEQQEKGFKVGDKVIISEKGIVEKDGKWIDKIKQKKGEIVEVEHPQVKDFREKGFLAVRVGKSLKFAKESNLEHRKNGTSSVEKLAKKLKNKFTKDEVTQLIEVLGK